MTQIEQRYNECIKIIDYALKNKVTISQATNNFNKSESYIRDTRRRNLPKTENEKQLFSVLEKKYKDFFSKKFEDIKNEVFNELHDDGLLDKDQTVEGEQSSKTETDNTLELDFRGNEIIKTSEKLLEVAQVNLDLWKLDKEVINKWDVTMKGNDGEPITAQNFQVKIWLSKRLEVAATFNAADTFKQLLSEMEIPEPIKVNYNFKNQKEKNLLEISIYDAHIGKLCWAGETGENYDVKIASKRFISAIEGLIERAKGCGFERIMFVVGNDFFNSDTILNTTTAGTPVDEDLRWQKTFKLGLRLLVQGIDIMRQYAPVDILIIPGNHDYTRSFFVGEALSAWYRNDENVKIDNGASPRKYYRYGKVLIGLTHGNEEKEARLPQLMALERKQDWAETDHREFHCGHFHSKRAVSYKLPIYNEDLGVLIRYMSSISSTDSWHFKKSFVGPNRAAEAYLWNFENGYVGQFNVNFKKEIDE